MNMKKNNITPEDILRDHSPPVVELVNELRAFVRETLPELTDTPLNGRD